MLSLRPVWVAAAFAACVPKGKHEILEIQLSATREAMSARAAQSAEDQRALEAELSRQQAEIALRQAQLDALSAELERSSASLAEARAELAGLWARAEGGTVDEQVANVHRAAAALDALDREQADRFAVAAQQEAAIQAFQPLADRGAVALVPGPDALVVRIPTGQLFQEGWATLSPRGEQLAADVAAALATLPGRPVEIVGHTDAAPRHSATWPSNWEEGFSRAVVLLRTLEAAGTPVPLTAASAAGTHPLGGDPADDSRVELWIDLRPAAVERFTPTPPAP